MLYPDIENAILNISENLKKLKTKNNYKQTDISFELDLDRTGYQKIEYGKGNDIKLSTILRILKFYKISFDDLIK